MIDDRFHLRSTIAEMWAERVPRDEATRILGYDTGDLNWDEYRQALYCWKMDLLEVTEDKHLAELLQLEHSYLKWRSKL